MRSLLQLAREAPCEPAPRLILLPGAYQTPEQLLAQGFAERVARHRPWLDLEIVDVEMAHVGDRAFLTELHERVVQPARRSGSRQIWLAGISWGGFIALLYTAGRPESIDGVCLLAPYLGNRQLLKEIAAAPDVAAWQPGDVADSDEERRIWSYIRQAERVPPIFLGFGREDRFAPGHRLLAAALPPSSVRCIDGGHEWPVWLELWGHFLEATFHDAA